MAERSGFRSVLIFVVGFALGTLFGAMALGGLQLLAGLLASPPEAVAAIPAPEPVPEPMAVAPEPPAPEPPTPAPAAAAPRPSPAPPPAPTVTASKGLSEVVFVGADGSRHSPDSVPPGKYTVHANWGDGLVKSGEVTVKEGKPVKLVCDPPSRTCSAK